MEPDVDPPRLPAWQVLGVIAGIYTTQSVIGAMTFHGVPAVLRTQGAALDMIGLVSLLMLPWALKFLWAPLIERYRIRTDGARRSRRTIISGQIVAILFIGSIATIEPRNGIVILLAALAIAAVVTATVDIACDGFTIEQLRKAARGWGNTAQVGGGYLGAMLGGGLFLLLVDAIGWSPAVGAMTVLLIALTVPMALTREPRAATGAYEAHRPSLAAAFARPAVRWGLAVVLLYQAGLRLTQGMIAPFLIDRGFDLSLLGLVSGGFGTAASLAGTFAAGFLVRRRGAERSLMPILALMAALFAGLTAAALAPGLPREALIALLLAKAFLTGAAFVALYTAMMNWSSPRQAGVDFTLFQCADAAMAAMAGLGGGVLAQHLGYTACFGLAGAAALSALVLLPALLRRTRTAREELNA